jgi:hypothetical protein
METTIRVSVLSASPSDPSGQATLYVCESGDQTIQPLGREVKSRAQSPGHTRSPVRVARCHTSGTDLQEISLIENSDGNIRCHF